MDLIPKGISVVIPTYNRAHLIKESLISLSKSGYQILFSTHSPALLSAENAMDAIQIYKNIDGTQARETITNLLNRTGFVGESIF